MARKTLLILSLMFMSIWSPLYSQTQEGAKQVYSNTFNVSGDIAYVKVTHLPWGEVVTITYVARTEKSKKMLAWFYNTYRKRIKIWDSNLLWGVSATRVSFYSSISSGLVNMHHTKYYPCFVTLKGGKQVDLLRANSNTPLPPGEPVSISISSSSNEKEWVSPHDIFFDWFTGRSIIDQQELHPKPDWTYSERGVVVYISLKREGYFGNAVIQVFPESLHGLDTLDHLQKDLGIVVSFTDQDGYRITDVSVGPLNWTRLYSDKPEIIIGVRYEGVVYLSKDPVNASVQWASPK